jgi:hypothetical protein
MRYVMIKPASGQVGCLDHLWATRFPNSFSAPIGHCSARFPSVHHYAAGADTSWQRGPDDADLVLTAAALAALTALAAAAFSTLTTPRLTSPPRLEPVFVAWKEPPYARTPPARTHLRRAHIRHTHPRHARFGEFA